MSAKRWVLAVAILTAGISAGARWASAHHGGGHTKYTFDDKLGTPCAITFKDGRTLSGLLFVMGNVADELMVEIGDSGTYSNVYLHTLTRIERRRAEGERHILDFTTVAGETFPVYSHAGNILFFKTSFGILDLSLPEIESLTAPPPAPKKAAGIPAEKAASPAAGKAAADGGAKPAPAEKTAAGSQTRDQKTAAGSVPAAP